MRSTNKIRRLGRDIWKNRVVYTLLIPVVVWYVLFAYMPMGGLSLAFKEFKANLGIWRSPWVGLQNFEYVFRDALFWRAILKTLYINLGRIIIQFPAPVILALVINEFRMRRYKRVLQTLYTFPHFFSWVIVATIVTNVLSTKGIVNQIITVLGRDSVNFLGTSSIFIGVLYFSDVWKYSGYGSIVYLASISGIDQGMYEAADLDGANRWQKLIHITLPSILPTIVIMFILSCGGLMTMGFDCTAYAELAVFQASI